MESLPKYVYVLQLLLVMCFPSVCDRHYPSKRNKGRYPEAIPLRKWVWASPTPRPMKESGAVMSQWCPLSQGPTLAELSDSAGSLGSGTAVPIDTQTSPFLPGESLPALSSLNWNKLGPRSSPQKPGGYQFLLPYVQCAIFSSPVAQDTRAFLVSYHLAFFFLATFWVFFFFATKFSNLMGFNFLIYLCRNTFSLMMNLFQKLDIHWDFGNAFLKLF